MRSKLEEENFFNKWQIGYRNKRCAMEHILRLADDAHIAHSRHHKGGGENQCCIYFYTRSVITFRGQKGL